MEPKLSHKEGSPKYFDIESFEQDAAYLYNGLIEDKRNCMTDREIQELFFALECIYEIKELKLLLAKKLTDLFNIITDLVDFHYGRFNFYSNQNPDSGRGEIYESFAKIMVLTEILRNIYRVNDQMINKSMTDYTINLFENYVKGHSKRINQKDPYIYQTKSGFIYKVNGDGDVVGISSKVTRKKIMKIALDYIHEFEIRSLVLETAIDITDNIQQDQRDRSWWIVNQLSNFKTFQKTVSTLYTTLNKIEMKYGLKNKLIENSFQAELVAINNRLKKYTGDKNGILG